MPNKSFLESRIQPLLASLELDSLLDTITALNSDIKHSNTHYDTRSIEKWKKYKFDEVVNAMNEARVGLKDFTILKPLARGAFGEVSIAKCNIDGKIYALKKQRKADMLAMLEKANFMEEKLILCSEDPSPWLTQIHSAFQTEEAIYLAMEFMAGGDIMSLCIRADETNIVKLDEDTVKFYIAEVVLALQALHERGWVHRDVKPENLLLDSSGHVKLADFGSCARLNERGLAYSAVAIGSPDYISPEILASEGSGVWHGIGVDVWSLGITLYEMLFGDVPFGGDTLLETNSKISQHQKYFKFSAADQAKVSPECIDLLQQMITDKATRIGNVEGMTAIRRHTWFKGIEWETLRQTTPPFVPVLSSPDDISNFDLAAMEDRSLMTSALMSKSNILAGSHLPFVGYSHTPDLRLSNIGSSTTAAKAPLDTQSNLKQKIIALESDLLASRRIVETDKIRINDLDASISNLESELRAAKRALDKEKIGTEEISKQRAESDREKMRMEVETRDLKRKLHLELAEKEILANKVSTLQTELDTERRKHKQLLTSIPDMEDTINAAEKKIEVLKAQLADQAAVSSGQELSLARLTRDKLDLQSEIAEALKGKEHDLAQIEELTKNQEIAAETVELLKSTEAELEETQRKLFARDAEIAAINRGQADLKKSESTLKLQDLNKTGLSTPIESTRTARSRTMSNNLSETKSNVSEQTIVALKMQLLAVKTQLNELSNVKAELELESRENSAKLRALNTENQQQQLKVMDLEQAQNVSSRMIENLRENLAASEAALSTNTVENEKLNQDMRNLQTQIDSMRTELTALTNEDLQKTSQLRDLNIQLSQSEDHKRISEDETLGLMAKYQRIVVQIDNLTERNIEMSNAESLLRTKIEELYAENSQLREQSDIEVNKLKSQHEKDKLLLNGMVEKMTRELKIEPLPQATDQQPASPNSPVTSPKRYRFQKNVIQKNDIHLRDEINKRQDMEAELTALKAAKLKVESEFEEYRNAVARASPKSPSVQTNNSDNTTSPKSPSNSSLSRGFFRPLKSSRKSKTENEVGPIMFSGWLKVRIHHAKSGGKHDWLKKYLCIRDGQVQIYDKEKDAELALRCVGNVALGNDVFLVRRAHPHEYIHNTPKEIACMFLLFATKSTNMQSKLSYSTTGEDQDSHSNQRLGEDQLVDLTEKLTKITDKLRTEEENRAKDEKIQAQPGTSKEDRGKAVERIKETDKTIKTLLRERISYEQFAKNAGLNLEEMMHTVEHKAKLMQQKRKSLSHVQNEEQDLTDLYELNVEIAEWESDMRTIEAFIACLKKVSSRQDADNQTRLARDLSEAEHTIDIIKTVIKNARERGRGSTQTRSLWNIERYVLRHWGTHSMVFREQQTGSLCNHCFNALFGVGQTLQCLECKFTCHKNCTKDESKPSCDEHKELSKLQPYVLLAADEINRQAWMDALDTCHQTARYLPPNDRGESMISLYHSAQASTADLDSPIRLANLHAQSSELQINSPV